MVAVSRVALALSFTVATVFGRSLRAEPWEGVTDYMAQYTSDAAKNTNSGGMEAAETEKLSSDIAPLSQPSSTDSWLKTPTSNKLDADIAPWTSPYSTDSWLRAPVADTLSVDAAPMSSASGTNSWMKQATDSWAFAVPHAVPDAADIASSDEAATPHAAVTEQQGASMDFNTEIRGAEVQPTSTWGEAQPRVAVQQDDSKQRLDAATAGQGQKQSQAEEERSSIGDDTNDGATENTNSDAGVHLHASGSIGGIFDGGEDRGKRGGGQGVSQGTAHVDAPSHTGGAVVDVRLDSELQESHRGPE